MRVGVWIRVSTDMQVQGESPATHRERAKYYCLAKGWEIIEEYDLSGVSGKSVINHPEARRMLADVASGKIQALVFSKLARLARNVKELLEISDRFLNANASLVSIDEPIDTSTPAGKLLYTLTAALGEWERGEISARVAASIPVRAREGKRIGGQNPFGYHWIDKNNLVPHPDEKVVVQQAFELFAEHKKVKYVRDLLNKAGYRARQSAWSDTTLKRLLTCEVYIGKYRRNYSRSKGDGKSWVLKPEHEWIVVAVEPLISHKLWDEVQAIFTNRVQIYQKGVPKEGKYLFSGVLVCGCGKRMYVGPYPTMTVPRYICQSCRNKLWEDGLIENFLDALRNVVVQPERLQISDEAGDRGDLLRAELDTARREAAKTTRSVDKLFSLYLEEDISKETLSERLRPHEVRKQQLRDEVYRLEAHLAALEQAEMGRQYLIQQAQTLSDMWNILSEDERRRLIRELVLEIRVGILKDGLQPLEIVFSFLPELMQNIGNSGNGSESGQLATDSQGFMAATSMMREG